MARKRFEPDKKDTRAIRPERFVDSGPAEVMSAAEYKKRMAAKKRREKKEKGQS